MGEGGRSLHDYPTKFPIAHPHNFLTTHAARKADTIPANNPAHMPKDATARIPAMPPRYDTAAIVSRSKIVVNPMAIIENKLWKNE